MLALWILAAIVLIIVVVKLAPDDTIDSTDQTETVGQYKSDWTQGVSIENDDRFTGLG